MLIRFVFLFIFSFPAFGMPQLQIIPSEAPERSRLEEIFVRAADFFESELGGLNGVIIMDLAPEKCLRTGYNRVTRSILFCKNSQTINKGLESVDVINHELFHAFLCLQRSHHCYGREDLHEALADVFAHRLNPDEYFGESFYKNKEFIRSYRTKLEVELVRTPHEQGQALTSKFIESKASLKSVVAEFSSSIVPGVKDIISGAEASELNRYRLGEGQKISVDFEFSDAFTGMSVVWNQTPGLYFERESATRFTILNLGLRRSEKVRARFYRNGTEIGGWNYYIGREL